VDLEQRIKHFAAEAPPDEDDLVELKKSWEQYTQLYNELHRQPALDDGEFDRLLKMLEQNKHYQTMERYDTYYVDEGLGLVKRSRKQDRDLGDDVDEADDPVAHSTVL